MCAVALSVLTEMSTANTDVLNEDMTAASWLVDVSLQVMPGMMMNCVA